MSGSEELVVLGTGNATVRHCYNTCFAIRNAEQVFLWTPAEVTASCASWTGRASA